MIILYYICKQSIMKTETIIIRINKKMKEDLIKSASENRRELSDFIRIIIEDAIKNKSKIT